jgi:hypothetical protein
MSFQSYILLDSFIENLSSIFEWFGKIDLYFSDYWFSGRFLVLNTRWIRVNISAFPTSCKKYAESYTMGSNSFKSMTSNRSSINSSSFNQAKLNLPEIDSKESRILIIVMTLSTG